MKQNIILIILLLSISDLFAASHRNNDSLLKELDEIISNKSIFHAQKENTITGLKKRLYSSSDETEKYKLCGILYNEYMHYQTDSALLYINKMEQLGNVSTNKDDTIKLILDKAAVYGIMGMYNEALEELQKISSQEIDKDILLYYYRSCYTYFGWLANYTANEEAKKKYVRKTELYRDSILQMNFPVHDKSLFMAEKFISHNQPDSVIIMLRVLEDKTIDNKTRVYINYTLSEAYKQKGDTENQIYYLTRTAIADIKMKVREYVSLQSLAHLMYNKGDLDRAYSYLNCSLEDAVNCNARLRLQEVTEFYPIIDKAYKHKETQEKAVNRRLFITISLFSFILIIAVMYLYYWMRKLSEMRMQLYLSNHQLVEVNKNLKQTGIIKQVYITRYLDRCVSYLDKLEQYRRSLEKLAMASKTNELFKAIKSEQFIKDERKSFYEEFDKTFLNLFPHFVKDFNKLLLEEAQISPKSSEELNTELRIFALIRLGVVDSNHIAHFLNYSLATVYNYRSKMRNKACGDKNTFEKDVMNIQA